MRESHNDKLYNVARNANIINSCFFKLLNAQFSIDVLHAFRTTIATEVHMVRVSNVPHLSKLSLHGVHLNVDCMHPHGLQSDCKPCGL